MKLATASLESASPYSQSRYHAEPRANDKEQANDYEARTWRYRCHTTQDGKLFITPMAFKNALSDAARYLSIKIPGKRNATYTKHFDSGVLVTDGLVLPQTREEIEGEWLFVNADGKRGSSTRVLRCYPVIREWKGDVMFHVLDDLITEDIFRQHLVEAGRFIGIGRFRPQNRGFYGRFVVKSLAWQEVS